MAPSPSPDCSGVVARSAVVRTCKKPENVDVDVHSVALVIALAFRPGFESSFAIHQVPLSVLLADTFDDIRVPGLNLDPIGPVDPVSRLVISVSRIDSDARFDTLVFTSVRGDVADPANQLNFVQRHGLSPFKEEPASSPWLSPPGACKLPRVHPKGGTGIVSNASAFVKMLE